MSKSRLLSQPLYLNGKLRVANRIVKAATAEGLASAGNNPSPLMIDLYRRWAKGGPGLLITGNAHVDRRYRERSTSLVIDRTSDLASFRQLASEAHRENTPILLQLNHPGRQCPTLLAPKPLAPSASRPLFRFSGYGRARAVTETEIAEIVQAFTRSAKLAFDCGFDGVQIHAAHGYLLSAFLSPLQNQRTDNYGGSLRNRARLLVDIVASARQSLPNQFTIAVKLNVTDFERGGFAVDDAVQVAKWVENAGADCLETSGGTYRNLVTEIRPDDYIKNATARSTESPFVDFADRISSRVAIPVILTGGMSTRGQIECALSTNKVQMVGLARPFCVEPSVSLKLLNEELEDLSELPRPEFTSPALMGPRSPFRRIRRYSAFAELAWYSEQMRQIAKGQNLHSRLTPHAALTRMSQRDAHFINATVP